MAEIPKRVIAPAEILQKIVAIIMAEIIF